MRWLRNLKTMKKLLLGFSAVCAVVGAMGWIGVSGIADVKERLRIVYADYTVAATNLGKASGDMLRCRQAVLASLDDGDPNAIAATEVRRGEFKGRIIACLDAYAATELRVSQNGRDERNDLDAFRKAVEAYVASADATMDLMRRSAESADPNQATALREQARALAFGDSAAKLDAAVEAFNELLQTVAEVAKDMNEGGNATAERATWTMAGGTALAIALSITVGYFLARLISGPLNRTVEVLRAVAAGDFTARLDVDTKDEVGEMAVALNRTVDSVRTSLEAVRVSLERVAEGDFTAQVAVENEKTEVGRMSIALNRTVNAVRTSLEAVRGVLEKVAEGDFTAQVAVENEKTEIGRMSVALNATITAVRGALAEVRSVADGVAAASAQLSSAGEEISSGAQQQASSLEETASSLEEITSTVRQNADNAEQANQLAAGAKESAEKGGAVVAAAVRAMGDINEASRKIAAIIGTIDEIAFQTNLLALNAAVEAARAGEQGRGFAVVAGEVRNLAQRSAGAAKEIKELIGDSVRKVEAGTDLVNKSGETLAEIVGSVKRVTDIVGEIAAASREQSAGIEQVNTAVTQMDTVTQANAAQTEELSGTAESLSGQSRDLQALVSRFNLGGDAVRPSATLPATPSAAKGNAKPSTNGRSATRKSAANGNTHARASERELDLIGAVTGGRQGSRFEEF